MSKTKNTSRGLFAGLAVILIALGVLMTYQAGYLHDRFVAILGGTVTMIGSVVVAKIIYLDLQSSPDLPESQNE